MTTLKETMTKNMKNDITEVTTGEKVTTGGVFDNLRIPLGLIVTNDRRYLDNNFLKLHSIKSMNMKDPLYDNLLNNIKG